MIDYVLSLVSEPDPPVYDSTRDRTLPVVMKYAV